GEGGAGQRRRRAEREGDDMTQTQPEMPPAAHRELKARVTLGHELSDGNRHMTATGNRAERHARLLALRFDGEAVIARDQTLLPWREQHVRLTSAEEVADAICRLAIRGAPLIGVAAAYGVALDPSPEA